MLRKILIANRGEIAVRVIRACAEMGIRSAAVYAEADRYSLHVKKADEAYSLGTDPLAGYLNVHNIVNLAATTGCDAIHPGYGFLSENPELALACARRGITFIGPTAEVIQRMGDKTQARQAMQRAGVPVTPGSAGNLESLDEALRVADQIGYPVMLKATSGGGGRGIRRCDDAQGTAQQLRAGDLRGDQGLWPGRGLPGTLRGQPAPHRGPGLGRPPRPLRPPLRARLLHPAAQPEADRDRPLPQLDEAERQYVGGLAVMAARSVGYTNAGTVEFLQDTDGRFYFMEMNTRIQVEHTITETITGVDLVEEQIRIAAGLPLRFQQHEIHRRGFAMQFRINAEDPKNNFLPSFGRISRYYAPGGPGVRTDTCIYTGYTVPPYYDSMLAKVIVWALSWEDVLNRGSRTLRDLGVFGIKTTIPFYQEILGNPEFRSGHFNTGFLEAHPELLQYSEKRRKEDIAAALAAAIAAHAGL